MKNEPTPKQKSIFDFIRRYTEDNQMPPSLREIGRFFALSVGTVQDQVEALRRKGLLNKDDTKARGLRLPVAPGRIPVLGRVHAGPLHGAFENVEGHLSASVGMATHNHFGLRIKGDSMIDAGLLEGDLVIVRQQPVAEVGSIVVARVDDETTVKMLQRDKKGELYLEPANPLYQPLRGPFDIVGVVVELRRLYKKQTRGGFHA